jgi:hypothetical protein
MTNDFVVFLNAYSALIQALATVVLVVLTSYYVRQARKSAQELEQTRRSEFLPLLSVRMETRDTRTIDVYLSNIGHGIAQDPTVALPFEKPQQPMKMMAPGQDNELVTFENVGIPEILELPENERVLRVEYGDIFGRTLTTEAYLAPEEADDGEPAKQTLTITDWKVFLPGDEERRTTRIQ